MSAQTSLGRGLSALLDIEAVSLVSDENSSVRTVNILDLSPGKYQPRQQFNDALLEDLSQSIQKQGILQPLIVRPLRNHVTPYEIVAGERRWQAAKKAGLKEVPVLVKDLSDRQTLEVAITENVQRSDLNPIEEAEGYKRLMEDFSYTQEEVSSSVGKSRSHIANTVRLLTLPDEVKDFLQRGQLTAGHARTLIGLDNSPVLARKIVEKKLSVRDAEKLASAQKRPVRALSSQVLSEDVQYLQQVLTDTLGTPVEIMLQEDAGEIRILFSSMSKLDKLVSRLTSSESALN
jgi:ParB family chromosome partitioning protein